MTDTLPPCPECAEDYAYEQGPMAVCPMCGHEWAVVHSGSDADDAAPNESTPTDAAHVHRDAVGNLLADGDTVTVAKDLKLKGAGGGTLKAGTKVRNIRLDPFGPDGHDIDANVPGHGRMHLKSSVVKKAT